MARIRYIKPDFFSDTVLAEASPLARLFYIGLFCQLDRNGIADADPKLLKREIFPYDDAITQKKVEGMLEELIQLNRLTRIEYQGKSYVYCAAFEKHQNFHPGEKPKYLIPKETRLATVQPVASNCSTSFNELASTTGIGTLTYTLTNTLMGTTVDSKSTADPPGAISDLSDSLTDDLLSSVKQSIQRAWLQTYPEPGWVFEEIRRASNWIRANPQRAPRSNYTRFLNTWLQKGWEFHRKKFPSQPARKSIQEILADEVPP